MSIPAFVPAPDAPARGCVTSADGSGLTELPIEHEIAFPNWLP